MTIFRSYILSTLLMGCMALLSGCIENDVPYPYMAGDILSIEVEGQRGDMEGQNASAQIDKNKRTVTLFVNDSVDIKNLKIKRLTVSPEVKLVADSTVCVNYIKFPITGFASLDSIPRSSNTRMNFTKPVQFLLQTYQDYVWTVSVTQIYQRTIEAEGMTNVVMDLENRQVIIYFPKEQVLDQLVINTLDLGGAYGKVTPDPTTVTDLSKPTTFMVYESGQENGVEWTVRAFHESGAGSNSSQAFAMVKKAIVSGNIQSGKIPSIEYKKQTAAAWKNLEAADIIVKGTSYTATLPGLTPNTAYVYRVTINGTTGAEQTFTTASAITLTNGSFDDWYSEITGALKKTLWNPWPSGGISFWDTGNRGATTVSDSNSTPSEETYKGTGKAAKLESKYIVIKFAAGNIFTGSYLETDGTNGILSFGREFNSFPTKLRVHYKYTSKNINRCDDAFSYLKDRPDSCHIYVALTDWDKPLEIRTKPTVRQLFDKNDKNVIAYAEFISGTSTSTYQELDLPLEYRYADRTPKYIVVVASASKYGDYFTGGEGSTLWVDDFTLLYD